MAFNLGAFASGAASGAESFAKMYQTYDNIQTGKSVRDAMKSSQGAMPTGTSADITPTANSDSAISGGAGSSSPASSGWSTDGGKAVTAIDALPKPNYQQVRSDSAASAPQVIPAQPSAAPATPAPQTQPTPPAGRTNYRPPPQGTETVNQHGVPTTVQTGPLVGSNQSRNPNTYLPPAPPGGQGTGRPPGSGLSTPSQAVPTQPTAPTLLPQQQQPGAMSQGQGIPTAPVSQTAMSGAPLPNGASPGLAQQTQGLGARMAGYMGNSNYGGST